MGNKLHADKIALVPEGSDSSLRVTSTAWIRCLSQPSIFRMLGGLQAPPSYRCFPLPSLSFPPPTFPLLPFPPHQSLPTPPPTPTAGVTSMALFFLVTSPDTELWLQNPQTTTGDQRVFSVMLLDWCPRVVKDGTIGIQVFNLIQNTPKFNST